MVAWSRGTGPISRRAAFRFHRAPLVAIFPPVPKSSLPSIILADRDGSDSLTPGEAARVTADAMYRAAMDCCYHHDRFASLLSRPALEAEHKLATQMCSLCDEALGKMAAIYESGAARLQRDAADAEWWHQANSLWHASREYIRRHGGCDQITRRMADHGPGALTELMVEFDLEASALLALRQAAEAYRKVRPELA